MKVSLELSKNIEKNAETYYEKAKKSKKKLKGVEKAYQKTLTKIEQFKTKKDKLIEQAKEERKEEKKIEKKEWYEKFRWFHSSEGFLCIGGRDATTNEIIIKKHTEKNDIVFHSQLPGSPFFVIKAESKKVGEATINEVAQATASYSKAWKLGIPSTEVYYVKPEQVTKTAPSGEYLGKGAFMIYGKKNMMTAILKIVVGVKKVGKIIGGPVDSIKANAEKYVIISQNGMKSSDVAKAVQKKVGGSLEEIQKFLPSGKAKVE